MQRCANVVSPSKDYATGFFPLFSQLPSIAVLPTRPCVGLAALVPPRSTRSSSIVRRSSMCDVVEISGGPSSTCSTGGGTGTSSSCPPRENDASSCAAVVASVTTATTPIVPTDDDILCGQDRTFARRRGNVIYYDLIQAQALRYSISSSKYEKMQLTKNIVAEMQSHGARFLRKTFRRQEGCGGGGGRNSSGDWVELSLVAARDRVSHALRFAARCSKTYHAVVASKAPTTVMNQESSSSNNNNSEKWQICREQVDTPPTRNGSFSVAATTLAVVPEPAERALNAAVPAHFLRDEFDNNDFFLPIPRVESDGNGQGDTISKNANISNNSSSIHNSNSQGGRHFSGPIVTAPLQGKNESRVTTMPKMAENDLGGGGSGSSSSLSALQSPQRLQSLMSTRAPTAKTSTERSRIVSRETPILGDDVADDNVGMDVDLKIPPAGAGQQICRAAPFFEQRGCDSSTAPSDDAHVAAAGSSSRLRRTASSLSSPSFVNVAMSAALLPTSTITRGIISEGKRNGNKGGDGGDGNNGSLNCWTSKGSQERWATGSALHSFPSSLGQPDYVKAETMTEYPHSAAPKATITLVDRSDFSTTTATATLPKPPPVVQAPNESLNCNTTVAVEALMSLRNLRTE